MSFSTFACYSSQESEAHIDDEFSYQMDLSKPNNKEIFVTIFGSSKEECSDSISSFFELQKQEEINAKEEFIFLNNLQLQKQRRLFEKEIEYNQATAGKPLPMYKHKTRPTGLDFLPIDSPLRDRKFLLELSQNPKNKKSLEKVAGCLNNVSRLNELETEFRNLKSYKNRHYVYLPGLHGLKRKMIKSNYNNIKSKIDDNSFNLERSRVICSKTGYMSKIHRDIHNGIENAKKSSPQKAFKRL